jgi:hypothetical protein
MAICRIIETGATPEQYQQVREHLGVTENPPPGGQLHIAAKADDGTIRVIEVWDSREEAETFSARVMAARKMLGVGQAGPPPMEYLQLHTLMTRERAPA